MAENKKDSFTFSDKIKNSKPAVNPFAKKGASKIGNNGKPKQTLFERTRRDAPFMVAAAAALLMLPFLYKYSGTVNDDVIVPPGSEDSIFDPERFGFSPSAEDPNGQIAQLAGRDPLSLIKGWGDPEKADEEPSYDRDGYEPDDYTPAAPAYRPDSSNLRNTIPPQTRGAIRRAAPPPTKINDLRGASLNLRGGGGIGSRFGGAQLKAAAKQSSASKPKQGAKPVSLTPLRAANNPSRSYFGQGGAAQARASRDALSKSNATEALRDAMFAPVENHRLGGLDDGVFAAGGGPGKFDRNMNFKGIEPWWWDMMKQQEMEKWKWNYFLWRKGLVEPLIKALAAMLAKIGTNLGCCLIMGDSGCDPDFFFGNRSGGGGKEAKCGDMKLKDFLIVYPEVYEKAGGDFEAACKAKKRDAGENDKARFEWQGEKSGSGQKTGFFSQRWACLGGKVHGEKDYELRDRFACKAVDKSHNFETEGSGPVRRWNKYTAVMAYNEYPLFKENGEFDHYVKGGLCFEQNIENPSSAGGITYHENNGGRTDYQTVRGATQKGTDRTKTRVTEYEKLDGTTASTIDERMKGLLSENLNDDCVLYIVKSERLDWNDFRSKTINMLQQNGPQGSPLAASPEIAEKMFDSLKIHFVEGYAFGGALAGSRKLAQGKSDAVAVDNNNDGVADVEARLNKIPAGRLPMTYENFETAYVLRRNVKATQTGTIDGKRRRCYAETYLGVDGNPRTVLIDACKTNAARTKCPFANFRITAEMIPAPGHDISGILTYKPGPAHGEQAQNITVTLLVKGSDGTELYHGSTRQDWAVGGRAHYTLVDPKGIADIDTYLARSTTTSSSSTSATATTTTETTTTSTEKNNTIIAYWTATYEQEESKDDTSYTNAGKVQDIQQNSQTIIDDNPDPALTRLARFMDDIPAAFQERRKLEDAVNDRIASGNVKIQTSDFKKDQWNDDLPQLNEAYASSQAAVDYVQGIVTAYNDNLDRTDPQKTKPRMSTTLKGKYPFLSELLDAMYIADALHKPTIKKNVVCDMARGIAKQSKDVTVSNDPFNNAFGTFAVYMDQAYLYPNETLVHEGQDILDKRFDCIGTRNGRKVYTCKYPWGNYIRNMSGPWENFKQDMDNDIKPFPLKDLLPDEVSKTDSAGSASKTAWRKNYYEATRNIFGEGGECTAFGDEEMRLSDAILYVKKVIENGLSYKPEPYHGIKPNQTIVQDTISTGGSTKTQEVKVNPQVLGS